MRPTFRPAALTLALCSTACSTFSALPAPQPAALQQAEARLDDRLNHPPPPPVLQLCQDGSPALRTVRPDGTAPYVCPMPPAVRAAIEAARAGAPIAGVIGAITGALLDEVDLRFQLLHWPDQFQPPAPPQAKPK